MRIQDIIIGGFLILSCIPILATMLITRYWATENLRSQIVAFSERHLRVMADNIYYISQLYLGEIYQLAANTDLQTALSGGIQDSAMRAQRVGNLMRETWLRTPGNAYSLTIVDADGYIYFHSVHRPLSTQDVRYGIARTAARSAAEAGKVVSSTAVVNGTAQIVVSCPIRDYRRKVDYGSVVIMLPSELFTTDEAGQFSRYTDTFLATTQGIVLNHSNVSNFGCDENELYVADADSGLSIERKRLPSPDWQIVSVINQRAIEDDVLRQNLPLFLCQFLCVALYSLFVIHFIKRMLVGFNRVAVAMQSFETGRRMPALADAPVHELEVIYSGYNTMISHIQMQDERTRRLHEEQIAALDMLREAEVKALELRINPHFLYNTLNTINCIALGNGDFEVSALIRSFSNMLRYIVLDDRAPITLESERAWLKDYLTLQQKRYSDVFEYTLDFRPNTLNALIQKLIFQPFVENAITHGFAEKKSDARLYVGACRDGAFVNLCIRDNGCGMCEERLAQVRAAFNTSLGERIADRGSLGMGLVNTWYRLTMYYGKRASVTVDSQPGAGTEFCIRIPFESEGGNNHADRRG